MSVATAEPRRVEENCCRALCSYSRPARTWRRAPLPPSHGEHGDSAAAAELRGVEVWGTLARLRIAVRSRGRITGCDSPHGLDHGRVGGRRCTAHVGDSRAASLDP